MQGGIGTSDLTQNTWLRYHESRIALTLRLEPNAHGQVHRISGATADTPPQPGHGHDWVAQENAYDWPPSINEDLPLSNS